MGLRPHQDLGVACLLDQHPLLPTTGNHIRLAWANPSGTRLTWNGSHPERNAVVTDAEFLARLCWML